MGEPRDRTEPALERRRFTVRGTVQGVGFRPFVLRVARACGLSGWVRNQGWGVIIEAQGSDTDLGHFEAQLVAELPQAASIDRLDREAQPVVPQERDFQVSPSMAGEAISWSLAPDSTVCAACLRDLGDPNDRRHRYPFVTCSECGPRYTISASLPYDRPNTTMAPFAMCEDCRREYERVEDRRFHAQPIACPRCGPRSWLVLPGEPMTVAAPRVRDDEAALAQARRLLKEGLTVAIKGLGGFHLAADATSNAAVARLRAHKRRARKPLAVMVRDRTTAERVVVLDGEARRLLEGSAAPIVLAPARPGGGLSADLAPGLGDLGVMLPYTPLHHLLFDEELDALVMTSGNHPAEPIATGNDEALATLPADAYLLHDRGIEVACDDSVVRAGRGPAILLRRSRGFVPRPLDASFLPARSILALGAELKSTVTTLQGGELVVGRHLGDLDNLRAEQAWVEEIARVLDFGRVRPEAVAVDLHPELSATLHAEKAFGDLPIVRVQHHHAHMAAVLVEHGVAPGHESVAITLDGLGYGADGTIWGGEVLVGDYAGFRRHACLRPVPQPGGDRAALEPARMATSLLLDADLPASTASFDSRYAEIAAVRAVSPLTSSAGRLFDGVAAILGLAPEQQDYEGEAAARLEAAADLDCADAYPLPCVDGQLDTRVLVAAVVADRGPLGRRVARFHHGLADGLAQAAVASGLDRVVLGGGCLVNRLLLGRLIWRLEQAGLFVLWPQRLPAGDGGLSAGQAAVAACTLDTTS